MKERFPKLRNGPTAGGEAAARHLRDVPSAPYQTIQGFGWSAHKRGEFLEVRREDGGEDFVTIASPYQDAALGTEQHIWSGEARGARATFRRKQRFPGTDGDHWVILPEYADAAGGGVVMLHLWDTAVVNGVPQQDHGISLYRRRWNSGVSRIGEYSVPLNSRHRPVHGARITQGGVAKRVCGFYYNKKAIQDEPLSTIYRNVDVRTGAMQEHTIYTFPADFQELGVQMGRFYGGQVFRYLPSKLLHYAMDLPAYGIFPEEIAELAVTARMGDAEGAVWAEFNEPVLRDLFTATGTDPDGEWYYYTIAADIIRSLRVAPLSTGEIVMFAQALYCKVEGDPDYYAAFDVANTDPQTDGVGFTDPGSGGVTILKGAPGSLQVAARFKIPNRVLAPKCVAVSGETIVAIIVEAARDRHSYNGLAGGDMPNADFETAEPYVLYSLDNGQSWTASPTGSFIYGMGELTVAADGRFMIPILLTSGNWRVFAFSDPGEPWVPIGTVVPAHPKQSVGAVFSVGTTGLAANAMPGTPWVCDDRITPPWET